MEITQALENGKLSLPQDYLNKITKQFGKDIARTSTAMFEALWYNYLLNKGSISLPYWSQRFENPLAFNLILKALSDANWIICETIPSRNWSEAYLNEDKLLEYKSAKQLEQIRAYYKYSKYMLSDDVSTANNLTKINGKIKNTGLTRNGFLASSTTKFQFDTEAIKSYYDIIVAETNKGMSKVRDFYPEMRRDSASYDEVAISVINSIINNPSLSYSSGQYHSDSRGRNISGMLSKVFNPIGFKVARATLVIPEDQAQPLTEEGLYNVYLFIAELNGFKKGTVQNKVNYGRDCYYNITMPVTASDFMTEDHRKDFYENIWLARIYDALDEYFQLTFKEQIILNRYRTNVISLKEAKHIIEANPNKDYLWQIPIEIDMSASVLGYVGLLTNHKPFMERCNMLGTELTDAWEIKGIPKRNQAKSIMKTIYGSSQSCQDMWRDDKIDYTLEDINAYNEALQHGEIAVGDRFSKFIINNCNPSETMTLQVRDEQFTVECNRYRRVGETTYKYDIYDSNSKLYRRVEHTETKSVADLEQFRRFFVTALIHNLDSQVINKTAEAVKWGIDIHDAIIIHPNEATLAREVYAKELEDIHTNRATILSNYFQSIGIPASAISEWHNTVLPTVEELTDAFKCNLMVLK